MITYSKAVYLYAAVILLWWVYSNTRIGKVSSPPKPESVVTKPVATPRVVVEKPKDKYKPAVDLLEYKGLFTEALAGPVKPAQLTLVSGVCPPLRKPLEGQHPPILKELYSRVDDPHRFRDPTDPTDLVTWTHELSHGASNQVWNKKGKHGIYLLDGKGVILSHPDITMEQVALAIPVEKRGKIYKLYLVDQRRWWNDSPIYICDEWVAYTHGAIAHKQMGWKDRRKDTYQSARELEVYVREMLKVIKQRDPDYPEMAELQQFVEYQAKRLPEK